MPLRKRKEVQILLPAERMNELPAPLLGSGLGWFMESPHDFDAVHWDHATTDSLESRLQPVQAVGAA